MSEIIKKFEDNPISREEAVKMEVEAIDQLIKISLKPTAKGFEHRVKENIARAETPAVAAELYRVINVPVIVPATQLVDIAQFYHQVMDSGMLPMMGPLMLLGAQVLNEALIVIRDNGGWIEATRSIDMTGVEVPDQAKFKTKEVKDADGTTEAAGEDLWNDIELPGDDSEGEDRGESDPGIASSGEGTGGNQSR